nr:hypothetical protein [Tanacetum cinerariifolium]
MDVDKMRQRHNDYLDDYFESLDKEKTDKKEEMPRFVEDTNTSEVHTFYEFVAFLNLIKNDEIISKTMAPEESTKVEEDSESLEPYQWNIDKKCAPIAVEKVKEKLEHFGIKLEEEEDCKEQQSAYYGKEQSQITCYRCQNFRHYAFECPNKNRKKDQVKIQRGFLDMGGGGSNQRKKEDRTMDVTPNFDYMNDPTRKSTDHSGVFTSGPYTTVPVDHNNHGRSSYARAMIELRADVELKDTIMVALPKLIKEGFYTCTIRVKYEWKPPKCVCCKVFGHVKDECPNNIGSDVANNLKNPSQAPKGVSVGPKKDVESRKEVSNPNPFDVLNSVDNDADLGTNEKNSLVDDEGKHLKNVDYPDDHDSEDEVEPVDNEMTSSLALEKVGFCTNSLLEQWRETYENVDYYHDLYYDEMYKG